MHRKVTDLYLLGLVSDYDAILQMDMIDIVSGHDGVWCRDMIEGCIWM